MALAESIVRAVNAKQDPLPAVLDVIKQANIIVTVEGTGSRHKKDLYDLVMEAVAEARQESQPPPPDILTVLRMMLALIPPPLMNIVNAKVAIDMMRDERPADAANLSEDLNVELKKVRLQEPGAEKGVSEAVGRILKESQQATADVKCPQGHVVLVRYCNGPEQWDSWSMGPGGSPR